MSTDGSDVSRTADLPSRAQVVIVGGGVIGCSIAYHLAHLGWTDVVLLEQHQLTAGTTWHAAGLITSAGMADETSLFMSRYSRDLYARLEEETGHSTGFRPDRPPAPRDQRAAAGGPAPRGRLDARLRRRRRGDLRQGAPGPVADAAYGRRALGLLRRRRGTRRPGGCRDLAGQGRAGPGRPGRRGSHRDRRRDGARSRHRGPHRPRPHRDRPRGQRGRDVGPPVRRAGRGPRAQPGGRALLPDHRGHPRARPRPAGRRGPGPLRLLPARGRRDAGRALRAGRRAVVAGRGARDASRSARCRPTGTGWSPSSASPWTASRRCPRSGSGRSSAARSRSPPTCTRCSAQRPSWTATSSRPAELPGHPARRRRRQRPRAAGSSTARRRWT